MNVQVLQIFKLLILHSVFASLPLDDENCTLDKSRKKFTSNEVHIYRLTFCYCVLLYCFADTVFCFVLFIVVGFLLFVYKLKGNEGNVNPSSNKSLGAIIFNIICSFWVSVSHFGNRHNI